MSSATITPLIARFRAQCVIPVFYHVDRVVSLSVIEACYEAGLTAFEYTNRGAGAFDNFQFLKSATQHLPDLKLGIGTILDLREAERFLKAGADFIVSPALVPEMAVIQRVHSRMWIPGCATVSEIAHAQELGATLIKLYPADLLGPGFLRSVKAVLPEVLLMPTGGILADRLEIERWVQAGAACVGLGSQLFQSALIQPDKKHDLVIKIRSLMNEGRVS